jgi:hypothetical protein
MHTGTEKEQPDRHSPAVVEKLRQLNTLRNTSLQKPMLRAYESQITTAVFLIITQPSGILEHQNKNTNP